MLELHSGLLRILALGALIAIAGSAAAQANYPNKTIHFITPFPPGGTTNVATRLIAQKLTEGWGQQVLVDNRPGGNTVIGTEAVAKAPRDGYTILVTTNAHAVTPLLIATPYDAIQDFAPIATITSGEWILAVHPSIPANNLREFIALARSRPGELNYASSGSGGASHLATELFSMMAEVKMQHVPYKGGGPAVPDLIGGQVQLTFAVPIAVVAHINSGKLKAIAISGETRLQALPNVPTFTESGLAGFAAGYWIGALAPASTPAAIVDKLSAEIARILAMPDVREKLVGLGAAPFVSNPSQFAALLKADVVKFAKVIKAANIRIE